MVTGFFHHIGTLLIFISSILLLITTISAPVINEISILRVNLASEVNGRHNSVSFGTFGYCVLNVDADRHDECTGSHIGYDPAYVMTQIDNTQFSDASIDSTKALTRVMVLHPIVTGLAFISFMFALGAGVFGAILAAAVSAFTWVLTVAVMACDFALFGIIKHHVNDDSSSSHAYYDTGMWTILAAMILLFIGTFVVFFTCCSKRMHEKRTSRHSKDAEASTAYGTPVRRQKWKFWQRRPVY